MCSSVSANDLVLPPPNIALQNNSLIHFCWDNFDLNEETPSGTGTTHSTHGIVIQDVANDAGSITTEMTPVARDIKRTIKPDTTDLKPCFIKPKIGPNFDIESTKPEIDFSETECKDFIWFLSRNTGSSFDVRLFHLGKGGFHKQLKALMKCVYVLNIWPLLISLLMKTLQFNTLLRNQKPPVFRLANNIAE